MPLQFTANTRSVASTPGLREATQAEAEAGAVLGRYMSPLRVSQFITAGSTTPPGGSNTFVQFNDSSAFGGDAGLTYNKTTDVLTASGGVRVGGDVSIGGFDGRIETVGAETQWGLSMANFGSSFGVGPTITTAYSRHSTIGSQTIVTDTDTLFAINGYGSDGSAFRLGGSTALQVHGSPSATNIPTRWVWSTAADVDGATAVNRMSLDNAGSLKVHNQESGSSFADYSLGGFNSTLQVGLIAGTKRGITALAFETNGDHGADLNIGLSRSSSAGHGLVQNNDQCGSINIWGSDGDEFRRIVHIVGEVDGVTANNLVPGRLVFATCPAGAGDAFPTGKYVALYSEGTWGPYVDDGAPLGKTSKQWSDLFLASGAVINFNSGNATLTHSAGVLIQNVPMRTPSYAVAALPSAVTMGAGARALVTDANATTFASVVAAGGANVVPVYSDGTDWRIG